MYYHLLRNGTRLLFIEWKREVKGVDIFSLNCPKEGSDFIYSDKNKTMIDFIY